jgi:nucleotide-binding universal stress UspA family protein
MTTVLVPIDGSEPAHRALDLAIRSSQGKPEARIHALYVHPTIDVPGTVRAFVTLEQMRELATEQSRPTLDGAAARLTAAGIDHTVEMLEGDPAEVIARRARELDCDAIVMGSRGMGRIANLIIGSVATKVVHLTTLPVTLVK